MNQSKRVILYCGLVVLLVAVLPTSAMAYKADSRHGSAFTYFSVNSYQDTAKFYGKTDAWFDMSSAAVIFYTRVLFTSSMYIEVCADWSTDIYARAGGSWLGISPSSASFQIYYFACEESFWTNPIYEATPWSADHIESVFGDSVQGALGVWNSENWDYRYFRSTWVEIDDEIIASSSPTYYWIGVMLTLDLSHYAQIGVAANYPSSFSVDYISYQQYYPG